MMNINDKILILGSTGMVGSSIVRRLKSDGCINLLTPNRATLNLTNQNEVETYFKENKPKYVFLCSGRVGGIYANSTFPVEFLYENMMMEFNVIQSAYDNGVEKLLFTGSSCIFPKVCDQPIKEEALLSSALEPTNEGYAIAKIAGIKLCQAYNKEYGSNFISVLPCSLFGVGDNFDLNNSHLMPALMRKMHNAKMNNSKTVEIWGSGKPMREFLYIDDAVDAIMFLMETYNSNEIINIGAGVDRTISDIAEIIKDVVGFKGEFVYNPEKPDGVFRKVIDISKLENLGWSPKVKFEDGLKRMYDYFLEDAIWIM